MRYCDDGLIGQWEGGVTVVSWWGVNVVNKGVHASVARNFHNPDIDLSKSRDRGPHGCHCDIGRSLHFLGAKAMKGRQRPGMIVAEKSRKI